ncbi:MAG: response regulator [Bacteroidales bacterium]|nr:response regulator [Bacteroidales bacterium]
MGKNYIQKVLSVDDIPTNNMLVHSCLKFDGIQTISAESGQEALELIFKNYFSLFILDVMMSEMDGFELAEKIREIEKY